MFNDKKISCFILLSLVVLAVGLLTSISLMSGFHLLMILPILYCGKNYDWKKFPKSGWALLALVLILILSVVVNHNIVARPMKNIFKVKYYLIGALSLIPLRFYFQEYLTSEKSEKVLRGLLLTLLLASTAATVSGLIAYFTEFNPLRMAHVNSHRNGGVFGMLMTYGHSIAWLSVLLVAMSLQYKSVKKLITLRPLLFFTSISIVGLFTSHVRGAWIAFFAGCLIINKKLTAALIVLCVIGVMGMSKYDPSFWKTHILRNTSNKERVGCWLAAIKAFQEKPVLGLGYLNFEPYSKEIKVRYSLPDPDFGSHAHNDLLEILASSGILGGISFLLWVSLWIWEMLKRRDLATQLIIPFIVSFLVSGLTQVTFNDGENAFFLMIVYALSQVLWRNESRTSNLCKS